MAEQGPLSGQTLEGRYLIGELLGEGGFGMVYAGRHLLLDRPQAIKVLLERYFRQPKFRERFLKEAKIVAALDHMNIVHIDTFGMEEQTASAYLVMPFIRGGTFQDVLKDARKQQRPLDMRQVVYALEQISSALDYAHQRGVVHLDLKPQNLLVHDDGRLLLADFGLAHLLKQARLEGGTSLKYGTPHYMAPEHIQGHPEKQSDVYALGVMLYEMLVGRRPFEGEGLGVEAVMLKHLTDLPLPLRKWRPDLPLELEGVLERALAKEAALRYQSAGELLVAFKDALVRAQKRVRKVEEERLRQEEEARLRKAEEERVRKVKEERLRQEGGWGAPAQDLRGQPQGGWGAANPTQQFVPVQENHSLTPLSSQRSDQVRGLFIAGSRIASCIVLLGGLLTYFLLPFDLPAHIPWPYYLLTRLLEAIYVPGFIFLVSYLVYEPWYMSSSMYSYCSFIITLFVVAGGCLALQLIFVPLVFTFWGQVLLIGLLTLVYMVALVLFALAGTLADGSLRKTIPK
jgi:serine/threonine protein kinase